MADIFVSDGVRRLERGELPVLVTSVYGDGAAHSDVLDAATVREAGSSDAREVLARDDAGAFSGNPYECRLTKGRAVADARQQYQEILGFGGAITDAVALNYQQLSEQQRREFLDWYFGAEGANCTFCRIPIQSCDFGLGPRSYVRRPWDRNLRHFDLRHDRAHVLPVLHDALARRSAECEQGGAPLHFMATPWSPPWYLKTNLFPRFGGHLRRGARRRWAQMIARFAQEYRAEGVPVSRISIQNEPEARQVWESCLMSGVEEAELALLVRQELDYVGCEDVKLLVWDHNKDRLPDRVEESMRVPGAAEVIDGVAFHWYAQEDHFENVARTGQQWPGLELVASEGTESFCPIDAEPLRHAEHYAHDIIGDLNAGAQAWVDWNMLLDDQGGPTYVKNWCAAPVRYNRATHKLHFMKTSAYLAHFSRFIQPGARRIALRTSDTLLELCAFQNPDGSVVIVALEWWNIPQTLELSVVLKDRQFELRLELQPRSIATVVVR